MSLRRRIQRLEAVEQPQRLPETWPFQWSDTGLPWNEGEEPENLKAWCERHRRLGANDTLTLDMVSRVEARYGL